MSKGPIVLNKEQICEIDANTQINSFEELGRSKLYERFNNLDSVVRANCSDERFRHFFAEPVRKGSVIYWYAPQEGGGIRNLRSLQGEERAHYEALLKETIDYYRSLADRLESSDKAAASILRQALNCVADGYIDEYVFCRDNSVTLALWGMTPCSSYKTQFTSSIARKDNRVWNVTFLTEGPGILNGATTFKRPNHYKLRPGDVPAPIPDERHIFKGWQPDLPIGHEMTGDVTFTALFEKDPDYVAEPPAFGTPPAPPVPPVTPLYTTTFVGADNCRLEGFTEYRQKPGETLQASAIPKVMCGKGYEFRRWSEDPMAPAYGDRTIYPVLGKLPWWRTGWWRWLLLALLILLLLILLLFLLRRCNSCRRVIDRTVPVVAVVDTGAFGGPAVVAEPGLYHGDAPGEAVYIPGYGEVVPGDGVVYVPGDGAEGDFIGDRTEIPDHGVYTPVDPENPTAPLPVTKGKRGEKVASDRLNLFFNTDRVDFAAFERDFKRAYPDADYKIVGADPNSMMVQISVPSSRRDAVRQEINGKLNGYDFFVVDEMIMDLNENQAASASGNSGSAGWEIDALHVRQGQAISKGSPTVTVAVIDNGFNVNSPQLKGRIVKPYNVFTQGTGLTSFREDHGTHVASNVAKVAPNVKIMPVQISRDGKQIPFSALISGIMYAVHQGADVINVSCGVDFPDEVSRIPADVQRQVINQEFKNEEWVWNKVAQAAARKNAVLVMAAGNDNILTAVDPSHRTQTINVTAYDGHGRANFSNFGDGSTVSAPGKQISGQWGNGTAKMDGTSAAAPLVSGVVAVMKSLNPDLNTQQVARILTSTGLPINGAGGPLVQMDLALQAVKNGSTGNAGNRRSYPAASTPAPAAPNKGTVATPGNNNAEYNAEIQRRIDELQRQINDLERQKRR